MTLLLRRVEIANFKAFRSFSLDLEGRHLLAYGANGSGKSSLYWALYTLLQSARKPSVTKYFDPTHDENLLNVHEQAGSSPVPGEIALTWRNAATLADTTYRISAAAHDTRRPSGGRGAPTIPAPEIEKADLASDFVTYRFFFGFSHFRNSEKFNLWPLFENEILPFCVSTSGKPADMWARIKSGRPNASGSRGKGGTRAFAQFRENTDAFASVLYGVVDSIAVAAQKFYDDHFAGGDAAPITIKLAVSTPPSFTGTTQASAAFTYPVLEFGIAVASNPIRRPQSFLNEAKLTELALSVRFGASLVNLNESDIKLLVLDDLLVSLDMGNRVRVVEILLSKTFATYQKIILTHDLGLFREFQRTLGDTRADWKVVRFDGGPAAGVEVKPERTEQEKAEEYLHGYDLDAAAIHLRRSAESAARRLRELLEGKRLPAGEFHSLTENLRAARTKLMERLPLRLFERATRTIPLELREHIVPTSDADIDILPGLDVAARGRLRCARRKLRDFITDEGWKTVENVRLVDQVIAVAARVLNPAAHDSEAALHKAEVEAAVALVRQLHVLAADAGP